MTPPFSRREFLKVAGVLPFSLVRGPASTLQVAKENANQPNILIIVFDAWSASNTSLYGYERNTMPLLAKLADKAIVYHNHYSGANFTSPGTASLLTGVLPWSHRAIRSRGAVSDVFIDKNLFSLFENCYRIAYTHNHWAEYVLEKFRGQFSEYVPRETLFLTHDKLVKLLFKSDEDIATVSWVRAVKSSGQFSTYALYFSRIYEMLKTSAVFSEMIKSDVNWRIRALEKDFPLGLPNNTWDNFFLLEDAIDYFKTKLDRIPTPFVGYLHFFPPHWPYHTRKEFYGSFANSPYSQPTKDEHIFSQGHPQKWVLQQRTQYDEFLGYVDAEFYRYFQALEDSGLLENTLVVLTSDHGELFERGVVGHQTPCLFQPIVKVPLLVFEPGRKTRLDVFDNTSAIDILPTMLKISGKKIPDWIEGQVLPPFSNSSPDAEREIYALEAKLSAVDRALQTATVMLVKGDEKLIYYFGYDELQPSHERVELFNLKMDPEEYDDLSSSRKSIADELLETVKNKLLAVNRPYLKD